MTLYTTEDSMLRRCNHTVEHVSLKPHARRFVCGVLALFTLALGCDKKENEETTAKDVTPLEKTVEDSFEEDEKEEPQAALPEVNFAVAHMHPTKGNKVTGVVTFQTMQDGLKVSAELKGFKPNTQHGFHVHQYGDCTGDDGTTAGGHFSPDQDTHGLPPTDKRHAGDMGNLEADAKGIATFAQTFKNISLSGLSPSGEKRPTVVGRGLIVHQKEDDGGQPTGNAGARLACGVIGIANVPTPETKSAERD